MFRKKELKAMEKELRNKENEVNDLKNQIAHRDRVILSLTERKAIYKKIIDHVYKNQD